MTEDDSFVRTLHDNHFDEMPRLVYADWLDEQGDPRGAYLRAEVQYFRDSENADDSALKALQEGLDPIWINMVSRAPYGIIVPGLTFSETGPRITRDDLARIEERWQAPLPADYAAFLLVNNGGVPSKPYILSNRKTIDENGITQTYRNEVRLISVGECANTSTPIITMSIADIYNNPGNFDQYWIADLSRLIPIGFVSFDGDTTDISKCEGAISYALDNFCLDYPHHEKYIFAEYFLDGTMMINRNYEIKFARTFIEFISHLDVQA